MCPKFQFHKGPIKTAFPQVDGNWLLTFQFHEGPIKTLFTTLNLFGSQLFQFHEGPIKTRNAYREDVIKYAVSIPWRSD